MRKTAGVIAAVALAVTVVACSDNTGPSPTGGPYEYTLDGDLEGAFSGNTAVFGLQANEQGIGQWFINMQESAIQGVSIVYNGQNPGTGTFEIVNVDMQELPENEFGAFLSLVANAEDPGYIGNSVSGTITITENTAEVVRVTFQFTADGVAFPPDGPAESAAVLVSGDADALPAN